MERNDNLVAFIDDLLEPSESFARIFQNAYVELMLTQGNSGAKADFNDVAQVSGALNSLTRFRLQQFVDRLQEKVGQVHVVVPTTNQVVDLEVQEVRIAGENIDRLKQ